MAVARDDLGRAARKRGIEGQVTIIRHFGIRCITVMILIGNISYCTAAVIYYGAKDYMEISSSVFITLVRHSQLHINQSTTYQYLALCNSFVLKYIKYIPNNPSKHLVSLKSRIAIIYPTPKHQKWIKKRFYTSDC